MRVISEIAMFDQLFFYILSRPSYLIIIVMIQATQDKQNTLIIMIFQADILMCFFQMQLRFVNIIQIMPNIASNNNMNSQLNKLQFMQLAVKNSL